MIACTIAAAPIEPPPDIPRAAIIAPTFLTGAEAHAGIGDPVSRDFISSSSWYFVVARGSNSCVAAVAVAPSDNSP